MYEIFKYLINRKICQWTIIVVRVFNVWIINWQEKYEINLSALVATTCYRSTTLTLSPQNYKKKKSRCNIYPKRHHHSLHISSSCTLKPSTINLNLKRNFINCCTHSINKLNIFHQTLADNKFNIHRVSIGITILWTNQLNFNEMCSANSNIY